MASSSNDRMLDQLAQGLEATSKLTEALLHELKESERDFAVLRTELNILHDNVKSLSRIVREGDGDASLLTKIALMDQRVNNVMKWVETHPETHKRLNAEIIKNTNDIKEIQNTLTSVEQAVNKLKSNAEQEYRSKMDSINKQQELQTELEHIKKKSVQAIREEKTKQIIKVVGAVAIAILTFIAGFLVKNYIP